MAAVTICSDFGAPKNKVSHCFHCFPIYLPWSDGTGCHVLVFWMLSFKLTFSLSSFTFIKRLFSSSSVSAINKGGVLCISEVIDISPSNLVSSLCFIQPGISHDVHPCPPNSRNCTRLIHCSQDSTLSGERTNLEWRSWEESRFSLGTFTCLSEMWPVCICLCRSSEQPQGDIGPGGGNGVWTGAEGGKQPLLGPGLRWLARKPRRALFECLVANQARECLALGSWFCPSPSFTRTLFPAVVSSVAEEVSPQRPLQDSFTSLLPSLLAPACSAVAELPLLCLIHAGSLHPLPFFSHHTQHVVSPRGCGGAASTCLSFCHVDVCLCSGHFAWTRQFLRRVQALGKRRCSGNATIPWRRRWAVLSPYKCRTPRVSLEWVTRQEPKWGCRELPDRFRTDSSFWMSESSPRRSPACLDLSSWVCSQVSWRTERDIVSLPGWGWFPMWSFVVPCGWVVGRCCSCHYCGPSWVCVHAYVSMCTRSSVCVLIVCVWYMHVWVCVVVVKCVWVFSFSLDTNPYQSRMASFEPGPWGTLKFWVNFFF